MPSKKPRIATYCDETTVQKFKIVSAYQNQSMSQYLLNIINAAIDEHEQEHGIIEFQR